MIIIRTPLRISFFGGGTDFPEWYKNSSKGGIVIASAINKYCYINIRFLDKYYDHKYRIRYYVNEEKNNIKKIKHPIVREVLNNFVKKNDDRGFEIIHNADLPARTGLGSSSAFSVSLIHAINKLQNISITKKKIWSSAINIEQKILSEGTGSQDQIITTEGGFNCIKFNKKNISIIKYNRFNANINFLKKHCSLFFLGFARDAQKIEKDKKKNIINKIKDYEYLYELCSEAKKTLDDRRGNLMEKLSLLMREQWNVKKGLSNYVTNSKINDFYDYAIKNGASSGKILGAGGGGFFLFISSNLKQKKKLINKLNNFNYVNFDYDFEGTKKIY